MLVEITSVSKETQLNKWYRVRERNGVPQQDLYVRFAMAQDLDGNKLYTLPQTDTSIYVVMEYNGTGYP